MLKQLKIETNQYLDTQYSFFLNFFFYLFFSSRTGMEFVQGADVTPDSQPIRKVSLAPYKFQPQFAAVIRQGDILEDYYFFIKQKYSTRASAMAKTESERRVSMIYYLTSKSLTSNQLII